MTKSEIKVTEFLPTLFFTFSCEYGTKLQLGGKINNFFWRTRTLGITYCPFQFLL